MFEEIRAAISAAGPAIERLRQKQNCNEKYASKMVPWQNMMLFSFRRNRTHLESHESRTSEDQLVVRDLRSEVTQLKASAVLSNLTRNLEAKDVSQKHEIQSLQKRHTDKQTIQDSLNSWDEVNPYSVQGVCVDESVATSTSSFSRMTEPALSHPPRAGSDPELFLQREITMPKGASKLAAAPSAPLARRTWNTPVAVHSSSIPTTSLPEYRSNSDSP